MERIKPRWFRHNLQTALRVLPVTVLTGARQTGKTTLTRAIEPARAYFTLDDVGVLDQAERNPDSLLTTRPVILDEVQRAPQILLAVKRAVDAHRRAGDFTLTGSANLVLMKHVADTLAGRAIYLDLRPFCPTEWQERKDALLPLDRLFAPDFDWREWPDEPGDWPTWLLRGGFPPALQIASEADRGLWFAAYVQTYLERDLRQLSAVSSLPDFQRMMMLAAQRTGKLLNQADLARDAALSHPTTHRYLNLLETGCLITRIRPMATNPSTALVKGPEAALDRLWPCRVACRNQIVRRRHATHGRGILVGANPVSNPGYLARPRSATAQVALLARPCGARSGFHFGRGRQVGRVGNQGGQSSDYQRRDWDSRLPGFLEAQSIPCPGSGVAWRQSASA